MNRKLIFLDIDGTLVSAMAPPSELVAEAVRGARGHGHKVSDVVTVSTLLEKG